MSLLLFFARMLLISLAAFIYTVVLHWLKLPELTEIVEKVRARFRYFLPPFKPISCVIARRASRPPLEVLLGYQRVYKMV